jgi:hypothetical protein
MTAARRRVISDLRERIALLETSAVKKAGWLPFSVPEMDAALPGGGGAASVSRSNEPTALRESLANGGSATAKWKRWTITS